MRLEIITPLGIIFDKDISEVTFPGSEGEFAVLPQHSKLVTILNGGLITILLTNKKKISIAIDSGYVQVDENKSCCIVEGAVAIDKENSDFKESIQKAKDLLNSIKVNPNIKVAINKIDNLY